MVTHNTSTLSTTSNVEAEDMLYCTSEEADQRVIRHVAETDNFANITVTTSDNDVLLLLLAFHRLVEELSKSNIFRRFGRGSNTQYYSVNEIANKIGFKVCKVLHFFHAFSGCDTLSMLFKQ